MRTNAIVRIILLSLAILVLTAILLAGLGLGMYSFIPGKSGGEIQSSTGEVSASDVRKLEIDWVSGTITIKPQAGTDQITFTETGSIKADDNMVWKMSDHKLSIEYEGSTVFLGIQSSSVSKDLTITVPADWICHSLEIDAASAQVLVSGLTLNEVDFDGASGICTFENCNVDEMEVDTASGDITFTGQLGIIDINAMSANSELNLTNCPSRIDLESMSGDLVLTLPEGCGFTVSLDAMSSEYSSEFDTITKNGCHVFGDGNCRINVDAMSGDVTIRKGCTEKGCTENSHHH